jgi:hypothetical protein
MACLRYALGGLYGLCLGVRRLQNHASAEGVRCHLHRMVVRGRNFIDSPGTESITLVVCSPLYLLTYLALAVGEYVFQRWQPLNSCEGGF